MELESLSREYIKSVYGHSYTVREIQRKFPYSNKPYKKSDLAELPKAIITTTNPLMAMQYRLDKKPIIAWGLRINRHTHAFVFKSNEKQYSPLDVWD